MLDLVGTFQSIIGLGFKINDVLATFSTNQEDCRRIRLLVETMQAVVEPLKLVPPTVLGNTGMSAALRGLEDALERSVEVVKTCQKKCAIRGYIGANNIARDLDRVYNDISIHLDTVILANSVDIRLMLMGIAKALLDLGTNEADHPYVHLQQQVEKSVQTHRSSINVPADSNGSRAPLSYGSAESTSVKSVDGQGHPRLVTKMISSSTEYMTGVICIDLHPTKPWIVTGDMGGNVCIWDYLKEETVMKKLVTKKPSGFANFLHECSQYYKEEAGKHWVCSVKFITEKNWLVVGDGKGYIHVYDYTNTELPVVKEFKAQDGKSVDLAVHPTKPYLLSSSAYGNKIILWDWCSDDWKNKHEFDIKSTYPKGVLSLKFNPRDSNTFACVTDDERLMVGNIKSYTLTTKGKRLSKADYFFNRTDQHLMVTLSFSSQDAEIWDVETGKIVASLGVSGRRTRLVAGHPTLPILITALDDGSVCFWDGSTYRLEKTVHTMDEPADDLTLVTDVNGITRLAVTSKSTIAIMEVSYSPMPITSGLTGGGDDG